MNNIVHINCDENNGVQTGHCHSSHYDTEDIDKLTYVVISSAKSIYSKMGPGLPKCIYQLNLYNDLLKKGLQLQTEVSMLNHCVKNETDRELIIVNEKILIECVVEDDINYHFQKRLMFDLENTSHTKGLLINFHETKQDDMITVVDITSVFH